MYPTSQLQTMHLPNSNAHSTTLTRRETIRQIASYSAAMASHADISTNSLLCLQWLQRNRRSLFESHTDLTCQLPFAHFKKDEFKASNYRLIFGITIAHLNYLIMLLMFRNQSSLFSLAYLRLLPPLRVNLTTKTFLATSDHTICLAVQSLVFSKWQVFDYIQILSRTCLSLSASYSITVAHLAHFAMKLQCKPGKLNSAMPQYDCNVTTKL